MKLSPHHVALILKLFVQLRGPNKLLWLSKYIFESVLITHVSRSSTYEVTIRLIVLVSKPHLSMYLAFFPYQEYITTM